MAGNAISRILRDHMRALLIELKCSLVEAPHEACACGKPIVFVHPRKNFTCSRCGKKWELKVEVVEVTKR